MDLLCHYYFADHHTCCAAHFAALEVEVMLSRDRYVYTYQLSFIPACYDEHFILFFGVWFIYYSLPLADY